MNSLWTTILPRFNSPTQEDASEASSKIKRIEVAGASFGEEQSNGLCEKGGATKRSPLQCSALVLRVVAVSVALAAAFPAVSSADSCPNAAVRVGPSADLPDCRAYEQVTPTYKGGNLVSLIRKPASGSVVFGQSYGSLAGAGSRTDNLQSNYRFSRTDLGWQTTPLEPKPDKFTSVWENLSPATDAGAVIEGLHPTGAPEFQNNLFLRKDDGQLSEIGPALSPNLVPPTPISDTIENALGERYAGASSDLSHLVYAIQPTQPPAQTNLWPGDATLAQESLYEYVGTGNSEPSLVGVENDGPLHGTPHVNEDAKLISQCGTSLGGFVEGTDGNTQNAISADDGAIFFTAVGADDRACGGSQPSADEIFARVDNSHTVAISEPGVNACALCRTSEPADATFVGASRDGSKVFFVTRQALLPSDTNSDPDLYEYDFEAPTGNRVVILSSNSAVDANVQGIAALSEAGSHVYFVARGDLHAGPNIEGQIPQPEAENLYVAEDSVSSGNHIAFITTLSEEDASQWQSSGAAPMQTTPDGRFLVFTSRADLTPDDRSTANQVFRYDSLTRELDRVSIGEAGFSEDGNTTIEGTSIPRAGVQSPMTVNNNTNPAVSDDGTSVVFQSPVGLTPHALNDRSAVFGGSAQNVYEYRDGHVYLISDGRDVTRTNVVGIDHSGQDIYFNSVSQLVPQDNDTARDLYDARVGGGFASIALPPTCTGEACQGTSSGPPMFGPAASATFVSPEAVVPPTPKAKQKKAKSAAQLRARRLKRVLATCRRRPRSARHSCEKHARNRYGVSPDGKIKTKGMA